MIPVNQVILGGDPLLSGSVIGNSLDDQLQMLEKYKQNLEAARQLKQQIQQPLPQPLTSSQKLIWDDIDAEVAPMTEEQKGKLFQDEDYTETYNKLQGMVNTEILNLVKGRIVDATFIEAPTSTKNKDKKRDPDMASGKKGNVWHFGMKMHISYR